MMGDVVTAEEQLTRQGRLLAPAALVLAAVNLRLAVTSIGPVLAEIRAGLGMSAALAGLLTSLPVVCFAAVGFAAPRLARRHGAGTVVAAGLGILTLGLAIRPYAPGVTVFVLLSGLALAGIAVVNVLMPMVVKQRFPDRVGTMTGIYGLQSTSAYVIIGWLPQIYRDAGLSAEKAGVLFAVTSFLGVPLTFVLSAVVNRLPNQSGIAAVLGLFGIAGYAGLWFSPAAAPWLCALLLGVVNCAFPLALTMIALRGRSPATVVRLSAFAQGVGYLFAIPGPILVGVLHDASGGWRLPLGLMVLLIVPQLIAGVVAGRDRRV